MKFTFHDPVVVSQAPPDLSGLLADGSVLCLLRTADGNGIGPLYFCRSTDGGATWSRPRKTILARRIEVEG